jgi:ribosomal protein S6
MKKIKKMKEAEKTYKNSSLNKIEFISILSEALRIKEPVMRHLIIATPVYNKQYQFVYINKLFLPPKFA